MSESRKVSKADAVINRQNHPKVPSAASVFWINLANLLKVKTLITLAFMGLLIMTTLKKIEVPQEIMMIASSITTYFFSRQERPDQSKKEAEE